jgi:hypothetical protein
MLAADAERSIDRRCIVNMRIESVQLEYRVSREASFVLLSEAKTLRFNDVGTESVLASLSVAHVACTGRVAL